MIVFNSINNIPIRLTNERWEHIISRHIEMTNEKDRVIETIESPDFIQKGDLNEKLAVKLYKQTSLDVKYLVVVYKEISAIDGFVLTAYYTRKPSERRKILWKL